MATPPTSIPVPSLLQVAVGVHLPDLSHAKPLAQSAALVQEVLHVPAAQANAPQGVLVCTEHPPAPSHLEALSAELSSLEQPAARHSTVGPLTCPAQRSGTEPSHWVRAQMAVPAASQLGREPTGAPVTGLHVPPNPVRLQASHLPPHALSQQTPSMQLSLSHSALAVHAIPIGFVQVPGLLPLQLAPAPHAATLQHTPLVHDRLAQASGALHGEPSFSVASHTAPLQ